MNAKEAVPLPATLSRVPALYSATMDGIGGCQFIFNSNLKKKRRFSEMAQQLKALAEKAGWPQFDP